jgi:hypothetical protein
MKKIYIFFLALCTLSVFTFAQPCTPDPNLNVPGFSPDSTTNLPPGTAGQYYMAVISAKIPTDTVYMSQNATVDSIGIKNVLGLPSGLTWTSDSPNNYWHGGTKGCMLISGTTNNPGIYQLKIAISIHGKWGIIPLVLPDTVAFYRIDMQPADISELSENSFQIGKTFPNPASEMTTIEVFSSNPSIAQFRIFNIVGVQMTESKHQLNKGLNNITVPLKQYPSGMYYFTISNGEKTYTRKLNISR